MTKKDVWTFIGPFIGAAIIAFFLAVMHYFGSNIFGASVYAIIGVLLISASILVAISRRWFPPDLSFSTQKKRLILLAVIIALAIAAPIIGSFYIMVHYGEPLIGAFSGVIIWVLMGLVSLLFYERGLPKYYGKITMVAAVIFFVFMLFTGVLELTTYGLGDPIWVLYQSLALILWIAVVVTIGLWAKNYFEQLQEREKQANNN